MKNDFEDIGMAAFADELAAEYERIKNEPAVEDRTADELREMIRIARENDGVYNGVYGREWYEGDLTRRLRMLEEKQR
jgi:hypothetical protein